MQFLAKHNAVKVIECNLRASRSLPFVSKVTGNNFAREATRRDAEKELRRRLTALDKGVHVDPTALTKVKFLKRRPRVCLTCDQSSEKPTG